MISGWLVRLLVSIAVVGILLFEAGSPWVTRVQLDGVAAEAARQGLREFDKSRSEARAKKAAEDEAAESGAVVTVFELDKDRAAVTVSRRAPSLIFGKWDKTTGYYDVSVEGASEGGL